MKKRVSLMIITFALISCDNYNKEEKKSEIKNSSYLSLTPNRLTDKTIKRKRDKIDSLRNEGHLNEFFYPNMSSCGGALYGYYLDSKLKLIDATFQGELGYTQREIYWDQGRVIYIRYREHFPNIKQFERDYPKEQYEFDPTKITFTDTTIQVLIGRNISIERIPYDPTDSGTSNSILIERLITCSFQMKEELEREKMEKNR